MCDIYTVDIIQNTDIHNKLSRSFLHKKNSSKINFYFFLAI